MKAELSMFKEYLIICKFSGVDHFYTCLHNYAVEVRQRPSFHVIMVDSNEKPKLLSFSGLVIVDELGINLVTKQILLDEQYVIILK